MCHSAGPQGGTDHVGLTLQSMAQEPLACSTIVCAERNCILLNWERGKGGVQRNSIMFEIVRSLTWRIKAN